MTLAEIRTQVHAFIKEESTDVGALFPPDNVNLDAFINLATQYVAVDLARFLPDSFLTYEDITLVANTQDYTLTKSWYQIFTLNYNVTSGSPMPLTYVSPQDELYAQLNGETADEPNYYSVYGNSIRFLPKPKTAKTAYARAWIIQTESTLTSAGPLIIPTPCHSLISLYATHLIAQSIESSNEQKWLQAYTITFEKMTDVLAYRIQGQPKTLRTAFSNKQNVDARDKAFYDLSGFFGR